MNFRAIQSGSVSLSKATAIHQPLGANPIILLSITLVLCLVGPKFRRAAAEQAVTTKILIVVGPSTHPPGTHEVAAGGRVMAHCLNHATNVHGLQAEVVDRWPDVPAMLNQNSTIVFIGDLFPPERMENPDQIKAQLDQLMQRGCGMVCIHYATGLRAEHVSPEGEHPLLHWLGGYFATRCPHHQSVAKVYDATITSSNADHPALRGWKSFTLRDEPYYNNYFGKSGIADNVTALAFSMLPPDNPKKEVIAWAVDRPGGGRGVGIVMPHFFQNWQVDELRMFILNSIVWSAQREIPIEGTRSVLPPLASFNPASIEPQPRRAAGANAR